MKTVKTASLDQSNVLLPTLAGQSTQLEGSSPDLSFEEQVAGMRTLIPAHNRSSATLMALLLTTGSLSLSAQGALAQTATPAGNLFYDSATGMVEVDNNAFNIQTGAFENSSNIPLPSLLPENVSERVALPVRRDILAPNTIEIRPDVDYINQAFNDRRADSSYRLQRESLQLTTQFDLSHRVGSHAYGEGIQVTVYDRDGQMLSQQSAFVRGDQVRVDQNGDRLPETAQLNVTYSADDVVELRVLNIRKNGGTPKESGIYFSRDGEFIVEDLQNGGDLDFNDGNYAQISGGRGEATALQEQTSVTYNTTVEEKPLDPEMRQEEVVETERVANIIERDQFSQEERVYGAIEAPNTLSPRLGHASGVRTASGEQLVYNRYAGNSQIRAGSDGLGITGQLSPLVDNPNVPPTLLSGNLTFNPFVSNNEAGLTGTISLTQFLTPTHRNARDIFGNSVENPNPEGPRLVEPAGLLTNRRWVGYVPPTPDQVVRGEQISSIGGIYTLPVDQSVVIAPPDPEKVGRGNAAYTRNVGGFLIEEPSGELSFVPQWTETGYAQEPITLEAGEADRVIYALVPQQAGQNLQLGQLYAVSEGANGYTITDGGYTVISADQQPQNFAQETAEVYAVEDTLPGQNAVTPLFNGIQGVYAQSVGAQRVPTVDVGLMAEADARVGNTLFPTETIVGDAGQQGYSKTTVAAGFYLGASLTGGVGNQEDTITRTTATVEQATDEMRIRRTTNTFATPRLQRDEITLENRETRRSSGQAFFDIDRNGQLTNVNFIEGDSHTVANDSREVARVSQLQKDEEFLVDSVTEEETVVLGTNIVFSDEQTTVDTDTYPNFSAVQGELAVGGVLNFGNTPWSAAANTARAELFVNDTVVGRSGEGAETGWRAEVMIHPFGEVQREAYQYDAQGNALPVYKTQPVLDENGKQVIETLTAADGAVVEVPVNAFVLDESGERIAQTVGTGRPGGPGVYLRAEDTFSDDEGVVIAGGVQFSF